MGVFWGVLKFQIFLGVLEITGFVGFFFVCLFFFFWGGGLNGRCLARAYVIIKNESTPTPWDCRITTTKSCGFVGGRDATVALPA